MSERTQTPWPNIPCSKPFDRLILASCPEQAGIGLCPGPEPVGYEGVELPLPWLTASRKGVHNKAATTTSRLHEFCRPETADRCSYNSVPAELKQSMLIKHSMLGFCRRRIFAASVLVSRKQCVIPSDACIGLNQRLNRLCDERGAATPLCLRSNRDDFVSCIFRRQLPCFRCRCVKVNSV